MQIFGDYWLFWFVVGFVFLLLEVATPGVVLMFFGLGSWTAMLVVLIFPAPPALQWTVFLIMSLVYLALLRRKLTALFSRGGDKGRGDSLKDPLVAGQYIGREVVVLIPVTAEPGGQVEFNGSNWQARSQARIEKGRPARIVDFRDMVFWVEEV
ncbi:MAG: NfeD family protein [Deltaproteobacteria bacterium]|jgi:membrane protein implicated in regulation of membrane protease activity|nr:NfeD family protein [Deltaproteobacteria bacterium]